MFKWLERIKPKPWNVVGKAMHTATIKDQENNFIGDLNNLIVLYEQKKTLKRKFEILGITNDHYHKMIKAQMIVQLFDWLYLDGPLPSGYELPVFKAVKPRIDFVLQNVVKGEGNVIKYPFQEDKDKV